MTTYIDENGNICYRNISKKYESAWTTSTNDIGYFWYYVENDSYPFYPHKLKTKICENKEESKQYLEDELFEL